MHAPHLICPRLVIFDMDGTLTLPLLDFDRMRAEMELAPNHTILEQLETLGPDHRRRAERIMAEHEHQAAQDSELQPGAREVLELLSRRSINTAIATRNSRDSALTVLSKHCLSVDLVYTREDGAVKPSPEPVQRICGHFGLSPAQSWMVGDYLYDVQSGNAAGAVTVLLANHGAALEHGVAADHVIHSLIELSALLKCACP